MKKISIDELNKKIELKKPSIVYVSDFNGLNKKAKFLCKKCNNYFETQVKDIFRDDRIFNCPHCESKKTSLYQLTNFLNNNGFTLLKKENNIITVKHSCGKIMTVRQNDLLKNKKCDCQKDKYDFVKKVYELVGDEYTVIGEYKNTNEKIKIKHNICRKNT